MYSNRVFLALIRFYVLNSFYLLECVIADLQEGRGDRRGAALPRVRPADQPAGGRSVVGRVDRVAGKISRYARRRGRLLFLRLLLFQKSRQLA